MPLRLASRISVGGICLFLGIAYFLAYALYGFADTDQGFIQALSWRVWQGEIPYQDFVYVRPPLSLYLHALPLRLPYPVLAERLLFYLGFSLTVALTTRTLQAFFDFQPLGISPTVFAGIAFVSSVHNFPPMPWHTTDGIFFAAIGIYFIATKKSAFSCWGGLMCLFFAAMCKQSFYPLLLVGPFLVALLKGWDQARWPVLLWGLTLLALVAGMRLLAPEWTRLFLEQTGGATTFSDLLEIGIYRYGKPLLLLLAPLIIVWRLQRDFVLPNDWKYLPGAVFWAFVWVLLGLHVIKALHNESYVPPSFGYGRAMFLLAVGVAIRGTWINLRAYGLLLALLLISWCSGISWGYATPMLYFTPVMFAFLFMLYEDLDFRVPRYFYGVILLLMTWVYAILYQYPYRSEPRETTTDYVSEYFPPMHGVRVGATFAEKCEEIAAVHAQYGNRFTVLPAFPSAHYFTGERPPISIDWAHNAETGGEKALPRLIEELETTRPLVLLEKNKAIKFSDSTRYGSLISGYVYEHWEMVEEKTHFWLYRAPESLPPQDSVLSSAGIHSPNPK